MSAVYIASIARTPIGTFQGGLTKFSAVQLGIHAYKAALDKVPDVKPTEVFLGNVLSANLGQAPARQVALGAGLPSSTVCTTVNKVCSSGMKSIIFGAQSILLGENEAVAAGGAESMTNTPYYSTTARSGARYGHTQLIDGIVRDGLSDAYDNSAMGIAGDVCAKEYGLTREMQDEYAIRSYERIGEANTKGYFADEIAAIEVPQGRGKPNKRMEQDEEATKLNADKLRSAKPVFSKDGTVTAANASPISDGASATILVSEKEMKRLGLKPLAKILGWGEAAQDPIKFTTSPALAIPKAIKHAGLTAQDIDYYEVNEAFSAVGLVNMKLLQLGPDVFNVFGGAVGMGHPIGASGSRIVNTLISVLRHKGGKRGVAGICNGGGGASAIVLELVD